MRFSLITTATAAFALLLGCQEGSITTETTPDIQSATLDQLSAGGGIAGYDFSVGGVRVGTLVVTDSGISGSSSSGTAYAESNEYWRWDSASLTDLRNAAVSTITISKADVFTSFEASVVDDFESGTSGWHAWEVNRNFILDEDHTRVIKTNLSGGNGDLVFELEADAWGGQTGTITYYAMMTFFSGVTTPEMTWYIDNADYQTWKDSEAGDGDDGSVYEVRLIAQEDMDVRWHAASPVYALETVTK